MVSMKIFKTPVRVKPVVFAYLLALWGGLTWFGMKRHPGRKVGPGALIGLCSASLLFLADFGHALAHIFSARAARAPMDEIRITKGMLQTLYVNQQVSPDVHRMRALGGPIFNVCGLLLSLTIRRIGSRKPIVRELATWSAIGHAMELLLSMAPLPMVDGGSLLKWTLVARGNSETEADATIKRIDWGLGIALGIFGAGLLAVQQWVGGVALAGLSSVVIAVTVGKVR